MIELTPAEVRARYRALGYEMPDDEMLAHKWGDAATGAAEWLRAQGIQPTIGEGDAGLRRDDE